MATGAQVWSQVAATNATIDTNINFAEGQAPSSLNDSCRSLMASEAKWIADNNGTLVTSGSSTALTLATNQVEAALTSGYTVKCQFGTAAAAGATLAVDGLAAAPILSVPGSTGLAGGEYLSGSWGSFTYSSTGTGQWIATPTPLAPLNPITQTTGTPTLTISSVGVMMGLGSSYTITPIRSGRIFVCMAADVLAANVQSFKVQLRYGTGTAPVNGAVLTGTTIGALVGGFVAAAAGQCPVTLSGIVTGLTLGTAYWLDVTLTNASGAVNVTLEHISASVFEI